MKYELVVDDDSDFSSPEMLEDTSNLYAPENALAETGLADNTCTISAPGLADDNYSWHVRARDAAGNESDWSPPGPSACRPKP